MTSPTANIAHVLRGIDFPCSRENMLDYARQRNAEDDDIQLLSAMPDTDYRSMAEVFHGLRLARGKPDDGEIGTSAPPEPRDFYDEITNPPPLAVPAPETSHEVLAPWLWPWGVFAAWCDLLARQQNQWWEWVDTQSKR